jgi:Transposase DDE domain group 1
MSVYPAFLTRVSASGWRISEVVVQQHLSADSMSAPMPTECSAEQFDFGFVDGRAVEAAFDAGLVTSDAGGLLLGAADRSIGLVERFARCFRDYRNAGLIERTHPVKTTG